MCTITINEKVDKKGIFISSEVLSKFNNEQVEITIKKGYSGINKNEIMKFAGVIDEFEAEELNESIKDCRTINIESWQ